MFTIGGLEEALSGRDAVEGPTDGSQQEQKTLVELLELYLAEDIVQSWQDQLDTLLQWRQVLHEEISKEQQEQQLMQQRQQYEILQGKIEKLHLLVLAEENLDEFSVSNVLFAEDLNKRIKQIATADGIIYGQDIAIDIAVLQKVLDGLRQSADDVVSHRSRYLKFVQGLIDHHQTDLDLWREKIGEANWKLNELVEQAKNEVAPKQLVESGYDWQIRVLISLDTPDLSRQLKRQLDNRLRQLRLDQEIDQLIEGAAADEGSFLGDQYRCPLHEEEVSLQRILKTKGLPPAVRQRTLVRRKLLQTIGQAELERVTRQRLTLEQLEKQESLKDLVMDALFKKAKNQAMVRSCQGNEFFLLEINIDLIEEAIDELDNTSPEAAVYLEQWKSQLLQEYKFQADDYRVQMLITPDLMNNSSSWAQMLQLTQPTTSVFYTGYATATEVLGETDYVLNQINDQWQHGTSSIHFIEPLPGNSGRHKTNNPKDYWDYLQGKIPDQYQLHRHADYQLAWSSLWGVSRLDNIRMTSHSTGAQVANATVEGLRYAQMVDREIPIMTLNPAYKATVPERPGFFEYHSNRIKNLLAAYLTNTTSEDDPYQLYDLPLLSSLLEHPEVLEHSLFRLVTSGADLAILFNDQVSISTKPSRRLVRAARRQGKNPVDSDQRSELVGLKHQVEALIPKVLGELQLDKEKISHTFTRKLTEFFTKALWLEAGAGIRKNDNLSNSLDVMVGELFARIRKEQVGEMSVAIEQEKGVLGQSQEHWKEQVLQLTTLGGQEFEAAQLIGIVSLLASLNHPAELYHRLSVMQKVRQQGGSNDAPRRRMGVKSKHGMGHLGVFDEIYPVISFLCQHSSFSQTLIESAPKDSKKAEVDALTDLRTNVSMLLYLLETEGAIPTCLQEVQELVVEHVDLPDDIRQRIVG